ncbi:MAG: glycosyltransferase [Planctomycetaceae bacterium]|nr:glycosyltransferase [Planctomycetaceae bacterium]
MSSTPPISVLVTVYNRSKYVTVAIQSVLRSAFTDFELIVVDDASTDDSYEIARTAISGDSRCRIYKNERNLGQFQNRNKAVSYAAGKYIKYLDSDDLIYPYSLSIMYEAISSFPTASHAICHSLRDDVIPYPQCLSPREAYSRQFLGAGCMSAGPSGAIIERERFLEIGGYRMCGVASDIDLWFRLGALWDTVLIQPALIWWRRHEGQAFSARLSEIDYIQGEFCIISDALNSVHCPLDEAARASARSRLRRNTARKLLRLATRQRQPHTAFQLWRRFGLTTRDFLAGMAGYR